MKTKGFSSLALLKAGWRLMVANCWFLIAVTLLYGSLNFADRLSAWLVNSYIPAYSGLVIPLSLILSFMQIMFTLGLTSIYLKITAHEKAHFSDLFCSFGLVFKYIGASILYTGGLAIGSLLLAIPAIMTYPLNDSFSGQIGTLILMLPSIIWAAYWGLCYFLYPYVIVDQGVGPIKALKASAKLTRGAKWNLLTLTLLSVLLITLGLLCLLVGILIAMPIAWLASTLAYRTLVAQTKAEEKIDEVIVITPSAQ